MPERPLRLVVVPPDPISNFERDGLRSWLRDYYNPTGVFDEVYVVSPREKTTRKVDGLFLMPAPSERRYRRIIADLVPAIVRGYAGYWPADLVCLNRVPGVRVAVSVHDRRPELMRRSLRYADAVICMSRIVRERVVARGVAPERTHVLPNRVDRRIFTPDADAASHRALAARFPPGRYILHVGRKSPEKNLDTVCGALVHLPNEYRAVFVGAGDPAPFQAHAASLGIAGRCHWMGSVPNEELPIWYHWCDCMCVPSRDEGFGIVFIEAAACGAPIITSDIAPLNEILTHGRSAHLVADFNNPVTMAAAIRSVCEDDDYRRRLAEGAVAASAPYDKPLIDAAEARLYREIMAKPPRVLSAGEKLGVAWLRVGVVARRLREMATTARHLLMAWIKARRST